MDENIDIAIYDEEKEDRNIYQHNVMFSRQQYQKIQKKELLKTNKIGFRKTSYTRWLKRENITYFCTTSVEKSLEIKQTTGKINIPLLIKEDIQEQLKKIPDKDKKKIKCIHIGGIQIAIKAHFTEGIDTPIKIAALDNRMNKRKEAY